MADPLIDRTLDDRYVLRRRLGGGGMGTVYLAEQRSMERLVAVKVIAPVLATDERVTARFLREARLCGRISHPRVVTVFDFGRTPDGLLYLVMEQVQGRTLSDLIAEGPVPVERALGLAIQICEALQAAHVQGIVHRDLKPGNVMLLDTLDGRDAVKVLDFGLARSLAGDDETVTRSGTMLGTPAYMPPEVARGLGCDTRGDLYALGVLLYELLVGQPPFSGAALSIVMHHAYHPTPALPTHVPPVVARLVERLMEKEPDDRPATAAEVSGLLAAALEVGVSDPGAAALQSRQDASVPAQGGAGEPRLRGGSRRWWALGGIGLVVLAIGGWWGVVSDPPDPRPRPPEGGPRPPIVRKDGTNGGEAPPFVNGDRTNGGSETGLDERGRDFGGSETGLDERGRDFGGSETGSDERGRALGGSETGLDERGRDLGGSETGLDERGRALGGSETPPVVAQHDGGVAPKPEAGRGLRRRKPPVATPAIPPTDAPVAPATRPPLPGAFIRPAAPTSP